mgnify:CR=1 FL=1
MAKILPIHLKMLEIGLKRKIKLKNIELQYFIKYFCAKNLIKNGYGKRESKYCKLNFS